MPSHRPAHVSRPGPHRIWVPTNRSIHNGVDIAEFHADRALPMQRLRKPRSPDPDGWHYCFDRKEDASIFRLVIS